MRHIVYTAIANHYDDLKAQPPAAGLGYVAFVDTQPNPPPPWAVRSLPPVNHDDPCRRAKLPKVLAHVALPEAEYSLWIDGSFKLAARKLDFRELVRRYLADADIAVFRHRERDCVYAEAEVIIERNLDDPRVVREQIARYRAEGFPTSAGLVQGGVILRRHTRAVAAFNEAWWAEVQAGSRRDQLSFPYVARKLGLRYAEISPRERFDFQRFRHHKSHKFA